MNGDDAALPDWLRHYARLVILSILIGLLGAGTYAAMVPRTFEAWSFVIERDTRIVPTQLGLVAEAVFRSAVVYGPAMRELGISGPADGFLGKSAELRPVPQTNTFIVVGRAHTLRRAEQIAGVTANSIVYAFNRTKIANLVLFGAPQPASTGRLSPSVILTLGGAIGLWVGLAVAVLHYRFRKPVLTLSRAVSALDPDHVTVMEGRRRLLVPRFRGTLRNRHRLAQMMPEGGFALVHLVFLGMSSKEQAGFTQELARAAEHPVTDAERKSPVRKGVTVIACNSSTAEGDLSVALTPRKNRGRVHAQWVELVWIR